MKKQRKGGELKNEARLTEGGIVTNGIRQRRKEVMNKWRRIVTRGQIGFKVRKK